MHLLHVGLRLQRGRYELLAPIGQGGTGSVWRALDHRESRSCAIKLLPVPEGVPGARPELGRAAVAREEEVASRLDHPGACRVHGTFEDGGWACVVMELCARSLADRIEDEGPLSDEEALRVCDAVAEALSAAHARGIVHRDVKPQNILLREDGSVALSDWGLAHARSATGTARTTATTMLGTLPYLAPEVRVDPGAASPASDVYALGITLAWSCTGRLPGDPYVPEVREGLRGALSDGVYERVTRACAWDPSERGWVAGGEPRASKGSEGSWGGGPRPPATPPGPARGAGVVGVGSDRASNRAVLVLAGVAAVAAVVAAVGSFRGDTTSGVTTEAPETAFPLCDDAVRGFAGIDAVGPRETQAVAVADVDEDGVNDSIFVNQLDESLTIWWGRHDRAPGDRADLIAGRSSFAPVVVDVNGDGERDLLLPLQDDSAFALLRGLGSRRFSSPERIMQGPSPRDTNAVQTSDGRQLLFVGGWQLIARPLAHDVPWPSHRTIADLGVNARVAVARTTRGLLVAEAFGRQLLELDSDLTLRARSTRTEWPEIDLVFSSDLLPDAHDELYARLWSGAIVRLPLTEGETPCAMTPERAAPRIVTLAHIDSDGVPDMVAANTCAGCTSNHMVQFGQR